MSSSMDEELELSEGYMSPVIQIQANQQRLRRRLEFNGDSELPRTHSESRERPSDMPSTSLQRGYSNGIMSNNVNITPANRPSVVQRPSSK